MNARQFWLVWSPTGNYPPRVEHRTEESAVRESRRLAHEKPGHAFHVLRSVGVSYVPDVFKLVEEEPPF